jgi:signal peptidase
MKILKTILKVIYNTLFVLLVVSSIFVILTSYNIIQGFNFYTVMSGSMEPSIKTGSVVAVQETDEYAKDDVITIKMKNDPNQTYTHRIIEINEEGQYVTKGDANESTDPDIATKDQILGEVVFNVPLVGYVTNFAKQPTGFVLLIIVPCIIVIASEINNIKEYFKEKTEEKTKDDKDKKKKNKFKKSKKK